MLPLLLSMEGWAVPLSTVPLSEGRELPRWHWTASEYAAEDRAPFGVCQIMSCYFLRVGGINRSYYTLVYAANFKAFLAYLWSCFCSTYKLRPSIHTGLKWLCRVCERVYL